jgi:phytoene synthase
MTDFAASFDQTVRHADPDRWAAARFVPDAQARADLIVLYALDHELRRIADSVTQPMLGEIRLAWWRESLEAIFDGAPVRTHPTLEAIADLVTRRGLERAAVEQLVEARGRDLDRASFDEAEALAWGEATAGGVMRLAAKILGAEAAPVEAAGRAWALGRLAATGRLAEGLDVRERVAAETASANRALRGLRAAAFPAVAYATLAPAYARLENPPEAVKKLKLTWAVLRGRL